MREGKKIEAWLFEMGRDKRREKNEREREGENKHPNRQMTITHLIINSISKPDVINLLLCQNTNTNFATGVAFNSLLI